MANTNKPFGLKPVRHIDGSDWNGQVQLFVVLGADVSNYFIGDVVMMGGSADANGIPTVVKYVAGGVGAEAPVGVVVGVHPVRPTPGSLEGLPLRLEEKLLRGSVTTDQFVMVCVDTSVVFEVQADSVGLRRNSVGSNVDVTVASPANDNQFSATVLDGSSDDDSLELPYRIVGFKRVENNEVNAVAATDEPFIVTLVIPNSHAFKAGTFGTTV